MRRFLISFESFPIELDAVRDGENVPQVITASRCINVGLFLSGDMRRDVEVIILEGNGNSLGALSFPGWQLKRISPDERSISYFLLKAHSELKKLGQGERKEMPNGIIVAKTDFVSLIEDWDNPEVFLASTDASKATIEKAPKEGVYIFEMSPGLLQENSCNVVMQPIWMPTHPERFILDINLLQDRKNECIEKSS
ncbi:MAG: hypothetical protein EAX95_00645 [Candidatus Thorarchaeota archaeon]|nr:hypothetical protein [Candidatus Thorarchaeota archaeon]